MINRELDANFDLSGYARMSPGGMSGPNAEMWLRAVGPQRYTSP
ncbi:hypothetical protein [Mycobacterium kiyosense]